MANVINEQDKKESRRADTAGRRVWSVAGVLWQIRVSLKAAAPDLGSPSPSHRFPDLIHVLAVSSPPLSDLQKKKELWPDQIDLFNQQRPLKPLRARSRATSTEVLGRRRCADEKLPWCILFYSWNVSDTSVHGLWSYFDLRYRSTFCVELYHLMDSTYTVWQLVQCDISLYIFTIHYNVLSKSYISFYVICLPSYRPYNLIEKKDLRIALYVV